MLQKSWWENETIETIGGSDMKSFERMVWEDTIYDSETGEVIKLGTPIVADTMNRYESSIEDLIKNSKDTRRLIKYGADIDVHLMDLIEGNDKQVQKQIETLHRDLKINKFGLGVALTAVIILTVSITVIIITST